MKVIVERVYDEPTATNSFRVLVDRLWPRGVTKEEANIDAWLKEVTPSHDLRTWFHEDKASRYEDFAGKYQAELQQLPDAALDVIKGHDTVTLVTAVKDVDRSHIPTLKAFIEQT